MGSFQSPVLVESGINSLEKFYKFTSESLERSTEEIQPLFIR